jgi:protein O-GlcNAc transferase
MNELADARARFQAGDIAGAEQLCRQILKTEPNSWGALQVLGMAAQQRGDPAAAVALFEQALAINPRDLATLNNLGIVQLQRRDFAAAIRALEAALAIDPELVAAVNNLGNVYRERGQLDLAETWYRRAVILAPTRSSAVNNLSVTLRDQGRLAEAASGFRQAIGLDPGNVAARCNLATTLSQLGQREESVAEYHKAFERDPASDQAAAGLLQELSHIADWPSIAGLVPVVDGMNQRAMAAGLRTPEQPLHNITRSDDAAYNLAIARSHSQATARRMEWQRPLLRRPVASAGAAADSDGRLRIGYLSADIWDHPIAHLSARLFACHDRKAFAIHVYAYGRADDSPYRRRIASDAEVFADIDKLTALAAAQRIADDRIDILVELSGHTSSARLDIPALRPAPVQLHWLGYPGSIGANFLDYLIADRQVVPDGHLGFYAEKILRLPNSYQVNGEHPLAAGVTRAGCGLPEEAVVLCCFNQIAKLDPVIFGVWMKLLGEFPDCALWLLAGAPSATANLRRFAAEQGIAPERLIFAPKLDKTRHLGRLALADLALDTRIYNGHTTTGDALFAGLPVVTMAGRHFASRVSASLLITQGLEELIACDLEDYHRLARALIMDPARRASLRAKVAAARTTRPLFDTRRFARNLEAAYRTIWSRHKAGLAPAHLDFVEG